MSARTHEPIRNAITRLIMTILVLILPLAATAADQPPYGATVAPFKTPQPKSFIVRCTVGIGKFSSEREVA